MFATSGSRDNWPILNEEDESFVILRLLMKAEGTQVSDGSVSMIKLSSWSMLRYVTDDLIPLMSADKQFELWVKVSHALPYSQVNRQLPQ